MRRTYRSKKDTGGVVDHKDLLQNLDERSSAFHAYFIQNIKQTKRELSCVGPSIPYGAGTKKVRKRKYVKRIVTDVETPPQESISKSAYLTPDKSIRVNKPMDPFDLLLNSSNYIETATKEKEAVPSNVDKFSQLAYKKKSKIYTHRRQKNCKKNNYSTSSTSDSDKENLDEYTNNILDSTDIKAFNLNVEHESNAPPRRLDDSINKIVNNISLLNKLQCKSFNTSTSSSFTYRKNRHNNVKSPILIKSPLCSTPFKAKYRGESIYKFSPISTTHSPTITLARDYVDKTEQNSSSLFKTDKSSLAHADDIKEENDVNSSIILKQNKVRHIKLADDENDGPDKSKKDDIHIKNIIVAGDDNDRHYSRIILSKEHSSYLDMVAEKNDVKHDFNSSIILSTVDKCSLNIKLTNDANNDCNSIGQLFNKDIISQNNPVTDTKINQSDCRLVADNIEDINEFNSSIIIMTKNDKIKSISNDKRDINEVKSANSDTQNIATSKIENSGINNMTIQTNIDVEQELNENSIPINSMKNSIYNQSIASPFTGFDTIDKNSVYKIGDRFVKNILREIISTSENDISCIEENVEHLINKEDSNIGDISSQDIDVVDDKFEQENTDNEIHTNAKIELKSAIEVDLDRQSDKEEIICVADFSFQNNDNDERESLYDTCSSENGSIKKYNGKEPTVLVQKMNDSSFLRYYKQMPDYESDSTHSSNDHLENSDDSFVSFDSSSIKDKTSDTETSEIDNNSESCYVLSSNEDNIESNSNNSSYSEENKCISFVTTRKRNEVTNNSIMSMFNDSYVSSSTDCDKTVLSKISKAEQNNEVCSDNDKTLMKPNEQDNVDGENLDIVKSNVSKENRESVDQELYITTRKSSIASRKSSIASSKSAVVPRKSSGPTRKKSVAPRKSSVLSRKSSVASRVSLLESGKSSVTNKILIEEEPALQENAKREISRKTCFDGKPGIVLQPGKKWERSLSIYRRITMMTDQFDESILEDEPMEKKGRKYRQSVIHTMEMQEYKGSLHNESINSRRSTFVSKPSRSTIRILKDPSNSRLSVNNTTDFDDLKGFLNEECDDTIIELSKLSLDQAHEVTVIASFHDTSSRITTARDYVLRRCNQQDVILFDECYPDTVLKNCHKIGEGVYGEVYLWRDRDGRARVLKIVPIAGDVKVNGEAQKNFHEVISEIVIAMELSALRAPIAEIDRHFDEGKGIETLDLCAIENATDVFNEVLAVRCLYGSYPSRLLDLWDLYDECKGSENDNPAVLPVDQQYIVLELANAGQDLESYQFNNAEQAHALFLQVAYGLAVAEEAFQFEHRDLHWGNVLIAPSDQKLATFVLRGRPVRVARCGVRATIIDYSLSRVSLPLGGASESAALYNDLAADDGLFDAVGDYQFQVYRLMREKLGNDWKNFEPYTNILWLHYTVDKMITALRYKRTNTKVHKHFIEKLKGIKGRILDYGSASQFVLTDNEI